ncbi:MAG: efflux RND transporter periplasmic adaptor subunit [Pseudomonadota bacterium]|nr:efflux RND transporter periplasmic adaptor subunit [Pseudomonadota bacterium]
MYGLSVHTSKGVALVAGALLLAVAWGLATGVARSDAPGWEAVSAEVDVGKKVRLEVRLKGLPGAPEPSQISVTSTRLDMGPDGMAAMVASVTPVHSKEPGILAFEGDLAMGGRWELKLSARVSGLPDPVEGSVIFTAVDRASKSDAANTDGKPRKILYYRNPMGLADISKEPKKDSMGMDYIPVYEDEVSGPAGSVQISMDKVQRAGVRLERASTRALGRMVRATGTVTPDEARIWITTAKFSGFVEKLHVAVTGAEVKAGQPLMTVWIENGDLLRKQADYLTALKSPAPGDGDGAIARAKRNLETFDFPPDALQELKTTREPTRRIILRARSAGTVLEKPAVEGMRFDSGLAQFKIADLSLLWVIADVAERDLGLVRQGQTARMRFTAYPGEVFEGTVSFVYPDVSMATRSARVRIVVPNPDGRLKIGLYSDVEIVGVGSDGPVLAVPEAAIIDNGDRRVVMVARGDGKFEPRNVETGTRGQGYVEIRKGLREGEDIVASGNFLIDAESNLRAALSAFTAPASAPEASEGSGNPDTTQASARENR